MRRAGMGGAIVGINIAEAIETARILGAADEAALVEYLIEIENAAVLKSLEKAPSAGNA